MSVQKASRKEIALISDQGKRMTTQRVRQMRENIEKEYKQQVRTGDKYWCSQFSQRHNVPRYVSDEVPTALLLTLLTELEETQDVSERLAKSLKTFFRKEENHPGFMDGGAFGMPRPLKRNEISPYAQPIEYIRDSLVHRGVTLP